MRAVVALFAVIAAGLGVPPDSSAPRVHLPAPIRLQSGSVSYLLARDGHAHRVPGLRTAYPRGASWFPATGTWFLIRRGRLIVGRQDRRLWRSHGGIPSKQLGLIIAGPHTIAFQHDHKLYLAPLGGAERPVASREAPIGFTPGGLFTYAYQGRRLLLRSDTGALVKVVARQPFSGQRYVVGGTLYFILGGVLLSARGQEVRRIATLSRLGISTDSYLQPVGRLLEFEQNARLTLVRLDGSVFASTPLPRGGGSISSFPAPSPDGRAVAFTNIDGRTETVYLLRPGGRGAIPLYRARASTGCERWSSVEWHGRWLLYSSSAGNLAAIDTAGSRRAIDLVHFLPKAVAAARYSASWA